jgi:NAD-dependent dihydropyrimidine dehydrogenase PreA subunit
MAATWYPAIDADTCSNCNSCADFCSHGVFEQGDDHPIVVNPNACVEFCRGCSKLCPTESISYFGDND